MKFGTLPPKLPIWHPVALLSTWGGSGLLPGAPGTWGSLFTLPLAWVVASEFGPKSLIILAAVTFIFGTWATSKYLQKSDTKDPGTIVIDEAAGQLLTLAFIPTEFWWYLLGFGLFRAADIIKPWPASWAERVLPGALGVMSDDIFAACYSMAILYIAHSFLTG